MMYWCWNCNARVIFKDKIGVKCPRCGGYVSIRKGQEVIRDW